MPLRYLLDEHLRGGGLWTAMQQHNSQGTDPLDVVRVGDPPDLPLGTMDLDVLRWMEREGRVFISRDKRTLPGHLAAHLQAGQHVPGVFVLRSHSTIPQILAYLVLAAYAGEPAAFRDRIEFIP
jgi:hypothetical protein